MHKIKDIHQAVVMLQLAKNYFEEVAFEANQPPSVVSMNAQLIDEVHCCPVKILKYHLSSNSRNSVLDIQALI